MASTIADDTKPGFYLDQSTLCDAFAAVSIAGSAIPNHAYRRLLPWVERVASEANLCLSVIHLLELAAWKDLAAADGVAAWLDGVPIVWMRKIDSILVDEADHWLQVALGLAPPPIQPFAPSMWAAFENWTPSGSAIALEHASLPGALKIFRAMNYSRSREFSNAAARAFRADRSQVTGWSKKKKVERLDYNRRVDLRKIAGEAHRRLQERRDPRYDALGQTWGGVMDPFVEFVERTPTALPARRVMGTFSERFAEVAVGRTTGSKKDRALASSGDDGLHAALGVYCDVFTCDKLTSLMLGDIRVQLGRPRQLAAGELGDPVAFVEALVRTWPTSDRPVTPE